MVEGPNDVYICANCTDLLSEYLQAGEGDASTPAPTHRLSPSRPRVRSRSSSINTSIGQDTQAKRALSVSVHNHYKRIMSAVSRKDSAIELDKSNVLLIGPDRVR